MKGAAVHLDNLSKHYEGSVALAGLTLEIPEGSVFGFLGPNGAGKTTALRILNGLARPSGGEARIYGYRAGSMEARRLVGFLPDVPGFYDWMTAPEFLRFTGRLFNVDAATLEQRAAVLLDMAGLAGTSAKVGGFSRGMRQRLGIAQALINAPRLLMLDEPTSALDPLGRRDVLDMISSLRSRTTVLFSTHILSDVERVCDRVAILDRGRVVVDEPITELTSTRGVRLLSVRVEEGPAALARHLEGLPWVSRVDHHSEALTLSVTDAVTAGSVLPRIIADAGLTLSHFELVEPRLEDVFVDLLSKEVQ